MQTISRLKCLRCGGKWYPRNPGHRPAKCAICGSPLWDKPRVRKDWPKDKMARDRSRG